MASPRSRTHRVAGVRLAFLLPLALLPGCGGTDGETLPEAPGRPPAGRSIAETEWRTVFRVGGSLQDTLLLQPARIAASGAGVSLADLHGGRVLRFDPEGRLLWSFGRKGGGPDEIAHPRDLKLDREGRTWLLDVGNGRLVVLSPDGRPVRRVPLDAVGHLADDLVPLSGGDALLVVLDGRRPLVRLAPDGRVLERMPFPWSGYARLHPMSAQVVLGNDPASGRWAAAFSMGDGFFAFDASGRLAYRGRFVEPIGFPEVVEHRSGSRLGATESVTTLADPDFAAASVTLSARRVYVLFRGRTEHRGRIVDAYDLADGGYLESLLLPRPVAQIAYGGGNLYATFNDPLPTLVAWRPEGRELP